MAIFSRRSKQVDPVGGGIRPINPAWDPSRPLPVPSTEWVDRDVRKGERAEAMAAQTGPLLGILSDIHSLDIHQTGRRK